MVDINRKYISKRALLVEKLGYQDLLASVGIHFSPTTGKALYYICVMFACLGIDL